jgi:hypothetical protein
MLVSSSEDRCALEQWGPVILPPDNTSMPNAAQSAQRDKFHSFNGMKRDRS